MNLSILKPDVRQAIENVMARKAVIAERRRTDTLGLRVSPHASLEGWQALYAARLIRENPARTSWTVQELIQRLNGVERELV